MTSLKPCPFCGSSNVTLDPHDQDSCVRCLSCEAEGPPGAPAECEGRWNNRPLESVCEAVGAAKAVITLTIEDVKKGWD